MLRLAFLGEFKKPIGAAIIDVEQGMGGGTSPTSQGSAKFVLKCCRHGCSDEGHQTGSPIVSRLGRRSVLDTDAIHISLSASQRRLITLSQTNPRPLLAGLVGALLKRTKGSGVFDL
jgi:hypothetical protein